MNLVVTRVTVTFAVTHDADRVRQQFVQDEVELMLGEAEEAGLMERKAFRDLTYGDVRVACTGSESEEEEG